MVLSDKKLHFTLINTEVDGDQLIGCSENTYRVSDQFNDMMIIQDEGGKLMIIFMSDHSNPNDIGWIHTHEPLLDSKIIYDE